MRAGGTRSVVRNVIAGFCLSVLAGTSPGFVVSSQGATPLEAALNGAAQDRDVRPQDVVHWEGLEATTLRPGTVAVTLRMSLGQDWRVYASNLKFAGPPGFAVLAVTPPASRRVFDPISNHEVDVYDGGEFTLTLSSPIAWTNPRFPMTVTYVGCTQVICLFPYTQTIDLPLTAGAVLQPATAASTSAPALRPATPAPLDGNFEEQLAARVKNGALSLPLLLALVFLGGMVSNLTPCVAPMVPITLRLLARQGAAPVTSALAYASGIVVTYSTLGIVAAMSGGMFGALLASKPFNVVFAFIMAFLALGMLGFGNFASIQALGNRLGSGRPSFFNTFLMGAGAGLVAAPCTGPILAALLAYSAQRSTQDGPMGAVLLMVAYSIGFALPYVLLGGAAAKVSKVRVHPRLQLTVKLTFAAVLFGLAAYYLRVPLYGLATAMRGQWLITGVALAALGLVLMAAWVASPAWHGAKATAIPPSLIFGLGLFALSQWATEAEQAHHFQVLHDERSALAAAKATGRPILVDFWAEWCEACKKMDATTFADPEVSALLAKGWVVAKLDLTESTPETEALQSRYNIQSLPTLALLPPSGDIKAAKAVTGYVSANSLKATLEEFRAPESRRGE